ncbi:MAG: hypothetical protein QXO51_04935 [Halobacteria archaeon]
MDRKIGSIIGLVGGIIAVAGFFLPWISFSFNTAALQEALGPLAGAAEALLAGAVPASLSITGFQLLTEGFQGVLALGQGVPGSSGQPDLGAATGILTLVIAVVGITLVLAILTVVSSAVNLAKGRMRAGMIGFGAATLALSVLIFGGVQMLVNAFYAFIQQQASQTAAGVGGGLLGGDLAATVGKIFSLGVGPGILLCIVGGLLGVVGGIMGRKKGDAAPAAPTPAAEAPK